MSADEDKKFNNKDFQLKDWLASRGVDRTKAEAAEPPLLAGGFDMPSTLLGITVEQLTEMNKTISDDESKLSVALIRHLHNKLQRQDKQSQQQDGKNYPTPSTLDIPMLTSTVNLLQLYLMLSLSSIHMYMYSSLTKKAESY